MTLQLPRQNSSQCHVYSKRIDFLDTRKSPRDLKRNSTSGAPRIVLPIPRWPERVRFYGRIDTLYSVKMFPKNINRAVSACSVRPDFPIFSFFSRLGTAYSPSHLSPHPSLLSQLTLAAVPTYHPYLTHTTTFHFSSSQPPHNHHTTAPFRLRYLFKYAAISRSCWKL